MRHVGCPVETYERLLDDLPGAARKVEALGAGHYRIERGPDGSVEVDDGQGARANVACVLSIPGSRLYVARGKIGAYLLPAVGAVGVVALRYEPDGPRALRTGGQIHARLEHPLLHALGRPLARLFGFAIDRKVRELVAATLAVCEAATPSPEETGPGRTS